MLHVVVLFEGFDQAHHLGGLRARQLDVVLRDHGDLRRGRRNSRLCQRFLHFLEGVGRRHDVPGGTIVFQIFGARFQHEVQQLVFGCGFLGNGNFTLAVEHPSDGAGFGWMFHRKGEISVPKEAATEDKLLDLVLEAGAEDLKDDGSAWYIVTPPDALEKVKEVLTKAGITPASAEIGMVPQNYIKLTGAQATQMVRLVEALEEHDDVQHVYANFDIDESEIQAAVGAN